MTREEAIKELQESHDIMRSYDIDESESRLMTALDMAIKALEQEPKTGHWIKAKPYMIAYTSCKWECSECEKSERFKYSYCPNCGAKMGEPQESEV